MTGTMPVGGMPVPAGGIAVPNVAQPYMISQGSVIPPAVALVNDTAYAAGTALPANTVIGPKGVWLSAQTSNLNPIVIPGGYQFGADTYTLPAAQTVVVPKRIASLVLFGRDTTAANQTRPTRSVTDIATAAANFAPNATPWNWLEFTRSNANVAERVLARRPAYFTIQVNAGGNAAARLVPIVVYHAPSKGLAAVSGMQRAAYSQPLYQAYDWTLNGGNGGWIDCNNALIGADFNLVDDGGTYQYAYDAYTDAFGNAGQFAGGAGATRLVTYPNPAGYDPTDARNQSIVAINQGFNGQGPPIYSANLTAFRTRAIDNIFYRGLANVAVVYGGVIDLLTAVSGGNAPAVPPAALHAFLNLPLMLKLRYGVNPGPTPDLYARLSTFNDLFGGQIGVSGSFLNDTVARRAAEFVRLFVSDHLPVGIQFRM
jgi:hypothetical protein